MKASHLLCLCLLAAVCVSANVYAESPGAAGQKPELGDETEKASYALGVNMGTSLAEYEMDSEAFLKALSDTLSSKPLTMTREEIDVTLRAFGEKMRAKMGQESGQTPPDVDAKKVGYSIGVKIGSDLRSLDMKTDLILRGASDALTSQPLALGQEEMTRVLDAFGRKLQAKQAAARDEEAAKNLAEAKEFLESNAKKEGVQVAKSGLQYKILAEGNGPSPKFGDTVVTHYKGTFVNGEQFDSSYDRKAPFETQLQPVGLIEGWIEALQMMKKGAKWELYVPPDLAYGAHGTPDMPPNKMLIFQIELVDVKPADAPPAQAK